MDTRILYVCVSLDLETLFRSRLGTHAFVLRNTDPINIQKPDKIKVSGGHEVWTEGIPSMYGDFAGHKHEPTFFVVWEMDDAQG